LIPKIYIPRRAKNSLKKIEKACTDKTGVNHKFTGDHSYRSMTFVIFNCEKEKEKDHFNIYHLTKTLSALNLGPEKGEDDFELGVRSDFSSPLLTEKSICENTHELEVEFEDKKSLLSQQNLKIILN